MRIPVRSPLSSARPARGALLAALMAVVTAGLVLTHQADGREGSALAAGAGQQVVESTASTEKSDVNLGGLHLSELADQALASANPAVGANSFTAASVGSQVGDREGGISPDTAPAAPTTVTTTKPSTTKVATTKVATTKPPTTPTTQDSTTEPAVTDSSVDPTVSTDPVDPTATTAPVDPTAPTETTAVPAPTETTAAPAHPDGYVDAGHGVWIPAVMVSIRYCESRDNYTAVNASSGAAGAYQFLKSSWASYGFAAKYGVTSAKSATPAQQDEAALIAYQKSGTTPWKASKSCWG